MANNGHPSWLQPGTSEDGSESKDLGLHIIFTAFAATPSRLVRSLRPRYLPTGHMAPKTNHFELSTVLRQDVSEFGVGVIVRASP